LFLQDDVSEASGTQSIEARIKRDVFEILPEDLRVTSIFHHFLTIKHLNVLLPVFALIAS